jgi:M6 family metalloprotease-like protein
MVRQHFVRFLAIAILLCPVAVSTIAAQSGFHPRWEIPGFDFHPDGGWRVKAHQVSLLRQRLLGQGRVSMMNSLTRGPTPSAAVSGTLVVPAIFFAYKNTDSAAVMSDTAQYTTALFSNLPPGGNPYTLRTFYEQLSNNALSMTGRILGWVRLDSAETTYTGVAGTCTGNPFHTTNCNGIFSPDAISRMQAGFRQALARVDNQVDFGQFDNDGPDGIPNSGDDDGYVDMIMFAHPTKDGACGGFPDSSDPATNNHIWSHRYSLLQEYVTNDHSNKPGFGNIRVRDYFTTSARGGASACDITKIMPIGTAAHEFGHALGLPDLYDTVGPTEGSGEWGLMGSGNFTSPRSPSRMESWSLNELGWTTVQQLTTNGVYQLDPVTVSRTVAYLRPTGPNPRGEFFLLENRQASLADTALIRIHCTRSGNPPGCAGGLLIWHVDSVQVANSGFHRGNTVNVGTIHGVQLEEADGLRQLWCGSNGCNRGDAGDPYPGFPGPGNTSFVFRTNPAALMNNDGSFAGLAVDQITQTVPGGTMSFRVRFGSLTVARASDTAATIQFDTATYIVFRDLLDNGSSHSVGFTDGQLAANGRTRWHFVSWSDGGVKDHTIVGSLAGGALTASVARDFLLKATAGGGGTVQADTAGVDLTAGVLIPENRTTTLTATPAGAALFCGWTGDTTASVSSLALGMRRSYIVAADFGSTASITSAAARPDGVMGATYADTLRISGGGSTMAWSVTGGALPTGVTLDAATGRLSGFPRASGNFTYTATVTSCTTTSRTLTLSVSIPTLATADVTAQLLGPTSPLNADQIRYLDFLGNNNGSFDIGDFLAWVKATGAPLSAAAVQARQGKGGPR